ncbi:unnamed protein product, partial [Iphiclides podalirius]
MGVEGARGAGTTKVPSHTAYFVAMGGVLALLVLVCCYFLYFCLRRVKELSHQEFQEVHSVRPPPPPVSPAAYPVQPGVRDSATAMALLCRSVPQDTVFPTSPASPARGVPAFSPASPELLPTSPSRLPMSPTSPSRRTFAYYTSPGPRSPLSPTSPKRRSAGYAPGRLPLSPTSPRRRGPMSPSRKAATVPARRVKSPHKPPAIILSPASQASTPLPAPNIIPLR